MTTNIQAQSFLDDSIDGHQVDGDTRKGVATLKGFVATAAERTDAERIARETEGVNA